MVYVFLADGFEIIEALAPVDMLRRAKIDVKTVGVSSEIVTSSCGVGVKCGMPGTLNLENSSAVQKVIDNANNTNAFICAICAAPSILGHKGLLSGKKAVCFPGFENSLEGCESSCEYVVTDGKFITAKGAGVCIDFGLEIVKQLRGGELSDEIRKSIQSR